MFIKICGMTRRPDIDIAKKYGADAVGFIFATSPRQVTPEHVKSITTGLSGILKVGVFVDESLDRIRKIKNECNLDIIQLHGDESPEYCDALGGRLFKALRAKNAAILQSFHDYPENVKLLLDTYVTGKKGGTGKSIDFKILDQIADFSRVILAGGIGVDNAADLVRRYKPFGLDVNSKVESEPGIKDENKIVMFMERLNAES